jgi:hypothetical protein
MSTGEGHPLGTPHLGALVIALSLAALVLLGVTTNAAATSPGTNAKAALSLVSEARAAMAAAGPVSATGGGSTHMAGIGRVAVTESDYAATTSGSQMVTMTSRAATPTPLPTATTVDVAGSVYVDADAAFWSASMGVGGSQAEAVADHWVEIPKTSPYYAPAAADLTVPSLIQDLFDANRYHLGRGQTIDGVRVVPITYQNSGDDSGPVTCYVAVGGRHLPVEVTVSGLTLHLSGWGKPRVVAAPAGAIPMPTPTPATPVVA